MVVSAHQNGEGKRSLLRRWASRLHPHLPLTSSTSNQRIRVPATPQCPTATKRLSAVWTFHKREERLKHHRTRVPYGRSILSMSTQPTVGSSPTQPFLLIQQKRNRKADKGKAQASIAAPQPLANSQKQQKQEAMEQLADIFAGVYAEMTEEQRAYYSLPIVAQSEAA
jgi:hypothetical protein